MKKIKLNDRMLGEAEPCFIIAEAGINHNGDIQLAKKLIDEAKNAGADAIKFQTHIPDKEMLKEGFTADYVGESLFDLLKSVELSKEDHIELKNHASDVGILFLSTPFSVEAVDLLEQLNIPLYKIGSGELTNLPLLEYVAKKGKPMIISTGMSTFKEIKDTTNFVKRFNIDIILMHCTSTYPAKYEDLNLNVIEKLRNELNIPIGLSDHSSGIYTSLAAIVLGACVIEKHFTVDKTLPGPDQKASITPKELKELVKGIRAIEQALGSEKIVTKEESDIQKMARESVVSLVDIPKGTVIKKYMVWVKRPGIGIPAKYLNEVIGKQAAQNIKFNEVIKWEDLG